ncbi:thiol reductant ABC exporter subunit CydC [Rhizobium sp. CFBP 8752]|uniref:thiol reductant ABC exporter subunit CydC n=1 Tax=Rhizobium sp. CFBP 8752 TaxID=2775301 RepID=UPI0017816BD0|nr:thiol reductant ABC exporter subunit CydC [Rhizobium sp. CFBP 8752]MBD8664353.1 thiol reductant ABC exporter subunit CydC [Rhizobium sp. CFBP 8752]
MRALLSFHPLFRRHLAGFAIALWLSLATLLAGVALLGLSGWFLTAAFLTTAAMSFNLFGPSAAVRGLSMLRILSRYGEKLVGHDTTLRVLADIREWLFRRLGPGVHQASKALRKGDAVSRLTADVDALDSVCIVAAGPLVTGVLTATAVTVFLSVMLPAAVILYAVVMATALFVVPILLSSGTRRLGARIIDLSTELRVAAFDMVDGHADLTAFGAADRMRARSDAIAADLSRTRLRLARASASASAAIAVLGGLAVVGTLLTGLTALERGLISGPILIGLLLASLGSFEATAAVTRQVAKFGSAIAAAERLRRLAETPPAVVDTLDPAALPAGGSISIEGLTFGYDPRRPVLRNLDLTVDAGSSVAIMGESGAGKSTLGALLLRLADPIAGAVRVAGTDIRDIAQSDLHARIALLEQNAPVFIGTIGDNLRIGCNGASDDECWFALGKARLADFVRSLPAGLETPVGEAGHTLSVGQARRLCLARTLLSKAEILVLDEPTSGLDRETELSFFSDLRNATVGRTVLLISHAHLPFGIVDRILHLTDGRLREDQ